MLRKIVLSSTVLCVLISLVFSVEASLMWTQTYGESGSDTVGLGSVVETSDGGYIIAGDTNSYGTGVDVWLIKTDAEGVVQWNQTYGGTDWDSGYSVVETSDGGYAIAGYTSSYGSGYSDVWLIKTDAEGVVQWNQTYGGTDYDAGYSVVETSDGGYAITGDTKSYGTGNAYVWLIKTDEYGIIPEFQFWIILPLFLTATLSVIVLKKRLLHQTTIRM